MLEKEKQEVDKIRSRILYWVDKQDDDLFTSHSKKIKKLIGKLEEHISMREKMRYRSS